MGQEAVQLGNLHGWSRGGCPTVSGPPQPRRDPLGCCADRTSRLHVNPAVGWHARHRRTAAYGVRLQQIHFEVVQQLFSGQATAEQALSQMDDAYKQK
jgi:hypothetical protein